MEFEAFLQTVPNLTDLELAVLLSLIAKQHCLVYTDDDLIDSLASELSLIASETFKLSYVVLGPEKLQSVEKFVDSILDEDHDFGSQSDLESDNEGGPTVKSRVQNINFKSSRASNVEKSLDSRMVVHVIIAKDFNSASHDVQIQVMELMLKRRIFSRTTVHPVPKTFLFLPIVATSSKDVLLNHHLNDRIFMSHTHTVEDGFPNLEQMEEINQPLSKPTLSSSGFADSSAPVVRREVIDQLRVLSEQVSMTPEIRRYLQDVLVFLRVERGVNGGVTPYGNVCCVELARYLAPLHGLDFVTPSLIALAVKKVFPHRVTIASPDRERSMQFGSDITAVKQSLEGLTPELAIEAVLAKVDCPL